MHALAPLVPVRSELTDHSGDGSERLAEELGLVTMSHRATPLARRAGADRCSSSAPSAEMTTAIRFLPSTAGIVSGLTVGDIDCHRVPANGIRISSTSSGL